MAGIHGQVVDQSHAGIGGVRVVATNRALGLTRTVETDGSGAFLLASYRASEGESGSLQMRSGNFTMKLSRFGIFTFAKVCAFITSFSPMMLLMANR